MTDPDTHLPEVRRLLALGWGNRRIGAELGIGKDAALRLIKKANLEGLLEQMSRQPVREIEVPDYQGLAFHPLANLFPLIEGEDFSGLVADIKAFGLRETVKLYQGQILDGRNRFRACVQAEIKPRFEVYEGDDPVGYVVSLNLRRRHLSDIQRASVAGKIANLTRGRPSEENPPIGGFTTEEAAQSLNVAPRQVERARVVHEYGVAELREALDQGEIAVSAAEEIARKPEPEQRVELEQRGIVPPVNGARAIMASRAEPDDSLDFFPTPPWATRALIERVLTKLGVADLGAVWEPACGEGHIAEVIRDYGFYVRATDVAAYGYEDALIDFLKTDHTLEGDGISPGSLDIYDWIITNPPFGDRAIPFVLRALERAQKGVAMFFRSQWAVEGLERYEQIFRIQPPTLCAFFVERVNLCKGRWEPEGSTATAYCWLVWIKDRPPQAPFWIPPGCRESLTRADDVERFTAHPVTKRPQSESEVDVAPGMSPASEGGAPSPAHTGAPPPGFSDEDGLGIPDFLLRTRQAAR